MTTMTQVENAASPILILKAAALIVASVGIFKFTVTMAAHGDRSMNF